MKSLKPIGVLALILLLVETIGLIIMPEATNNPADPMTEALYRRYIIIQIVVFTCSFIGFFTGLFSLIVAILKSTLKENALGLALLMFSFLIPIIVYYA